MSDERDETACALALTFLQMGQPQRALDRLDAVSAREALRPDVLLLRSHALLRLGRPAEAVHVAERGLAGGPETVVASELWWVVGGARWSQGDLRGADRALLAALALCPQAAGPAFDRVLLLVARGRPWRASRALERAAALEPGSARMHCTRARVLLMRGHPRAAARAARAALAVDPESVEAHAVLGSAGVAIGDADVGLRHSRRAASAAIGDRYLARNAREARIASHWAMAPRRLQRRITVPVAVVTMLAFLVLVDWLPSVGLLSPPADDIVAVVAVVMVIGSVLVPPWVLRLWARWRW